MTFTQISKGSDIFLYKGTVTLEEPVSVVEAGAKAVTFVSEGQYQLTAGAGEITSIDGGVHDAVITILGAAGATSPTVSATAGKILLRGGKAFTASDGSQLTLRAFDSGDGGVVWIEQSRYVAAWYWFSFLPKSPCQFGNGDFLHYIETFLCVDLYYIETFRNFVAW